MGVKCVRVIGHAPQLDALVEGLITATTECSLGVLLAPTADVLPDKVIKVRLTQTYGKIRNNFI